MRGGRGKSSFTPIIRGWRKRFSHGEMGDGWTEAVWDQSSRYIIEGNNNCGVKAYFDLHGTKKVLPNQIIGFPRSIYQKIHYYYYVYLILSQWT